MNCKGETKSVQSNGERDIILQAKEGNQQAFSKIISLYQERIFKLAFCFFHDREDAMEIVQNTFLRVYEKIDHFDTETHFKNWIYRIASNLCVDYYRKFKKKKHQTQSLQEWSQNNISPSPGPEEMAINQIFYESLKKSIQKLSRRQKMIFVLKHHSNFKYKDIAGILKISVGSVKSLHHRAITNIKKKLSHCEVINERM